MKDYRDERDEFFETGIGGPAHGAGIGIAIMASFGLGIVVGLLI